MIGAPTWRDASGYDLIRWARDCAEDDGLDLRPRECQVLLVLATFATTNKPKRPTPADVKQWGTARPSVARIARACGLSVTKSGTNSSVSEALAALETANLIHTEQQGRSHPAHRELLMPLGYPVAENRKPSTYGNRKPSAYQDAQPSGIQDENYQPYLPPQKPSDLSTPAESSNAGSTTAQTTNSVEDAIRQTGWHNHPPDQGSTEDDPATVRALCIESIESAGTTS